MILKTNLGSLEVSDFVAVKQIENKAKLPVKDKFIKPTLEFLKQLQTYLEKKFVKKVTYTQALQTWQSMSACQAVLAERYDHESDVAFWYGLPEQPTDEKFAGLFFNLGRVKAQQRLELGNYDYMNFEQAHDLTMLAYNDEHLALIARNQAIKAKMDFEAQRNRK